MGFADFDFDPDLPSAATLPSNWYRDSQLAALERDIQICEAVQEGLRSRTYDRGRYSVLRENGLYHFHALLTRALK